MEAGNWGGVWEGGWDSSFRKARRTPPLGHSWPSRPTALSSPTPASQAHGAGWSLAGGPGSSCYLSQVLTNCPWARQCLGILGLGTKMCSSVCPPHPQGDCVWSWSLGGASWMSDKCLPLEPRFHTSKALEHPPSFLSEAK